MFGCVRNILRINNNNASFSLKGFLNAQSHYSKFFQEFKKEKPKAVKRSCIPQQIPKQENDQQHKGDKAIFSRDKVLFPDMSIKSSDSGFSCSRPITNPKTSSWQNILYFPSFSTGSHPNVSPTYWNASFLKAKEYSCHHPDAIKTTFHHNSTVLSSSMEFTSKYKEEEMFAKGGFSQIYAGERRSNSTPVAIKHIPKKNVQHVRVKCLGNVYDEILEVVLMKQAAGRLCDGSFENPAVIGLMDTFNLGTEVIIVIERPPYAVDMHDFLNEVKRIPEGQTMAIFKQIINTALLTHKNGVFHRDLKLNNILVSWNNGTPEIRVIDFGCGDFVQHEPFRKFYGTPEFAPPELFRGETYKAEATTVWQIGAMLHIICARAVFKTPVYMKEDHKVLKNVSMECNDFLSRCLAFDPKQRPTLEDLLLHPWLE